MTGMITPAMGAGSTVLSSAGYLQAGQAANFGGQAQQQQENYSADVLTQAAGQQRAQTSADIADTARSTDLLESTIRARAAASGGGATDPTVINLESGVAGRGEYNVLSELYSGEEKARGLENQAALNRYMGTQYRTAGQLQQQEEQTKALSSLLQGGSSLFSKYGGGGFPGMTSGSGPGGSLGVPAGGTPVDTSGGLPWLTQGSDAAGSAFDIGASDIGGFA